MSVIVRTTNGDVVTHAAATNYATDTDGMLDIYGPPARGDCGGGPMIATHNVGAWAAVEITADTDNPA